MNAKKKRILLPLGVLAVLLLAWFGYEHLVWETTDNAQVQAHTLLISPKVPGLVLAVSVQENQKVKEGQLLVRIDDRDYRNALNQAESDLGSIQARARDAERNFKRLDELYRKGAVSQQQRDTAEATARETSRKLSAAEALLEQARLNLAYTEIKAPSDGTIARKNAEEGMLAVVGQPLLGFVEGGERWVVANFKETEIPRIRPGSEARVSVDAIPGRKFEGQVESLSPATGATFTLLPPDNATGNFTKVVQRVPVRIRLKGLLPEDLERLQAGLSAVVSVRKR